MTLFFTKNLYFRKIPPLHLFLVSSYFATHPTTLLLEILGGRMHWPPPPKILEGDRTLQSPLSLHPCLIVCLRDSGSIHVCLLRLSVSLRVVQIHFKKPRLFMF